MKILANFIVKVCCLFLLRPSTAADYPFSYFIKTSYSALVYQNNENNTLLKLHGINETACAEKCLYIPNGACLSFDFYHLSGSCYIRGVSQTTLRQANLTTDKYYNYYEKLTGDCSNPPVGVEDGTVSLSQISMSSYLGGEEEGPINIGRSHVRLNSAGGWCAQELTDISNFTEWVQIDFNEIKILGAVATQGFNHPDLPDIYITEYYITYVAVEASTAGGSNATGNASVSGSTPLGGSSSTNVYEWVPYEEGGSKKIFIANSDQNTIVRNKFSTPLRTQHVRLHPTVARNHPCLRLEYYGCRDDCDPNPCLNNGTCTDDRHEVWNVTCECEGSWVGDFCQVDFDECTSNPCHHNGTCVDFVNYYICQCSSGWEGLHCENETDECQSNPCQHDGNCTDLIDGYKCTCDDRYDGVNCEEYAANATWGTWQGWSECSSDCGDGNQTRIRYCDSPAAILNGTDCLGTNNQTRDCFKKCPRVTCPVGHPYFDSCFSVIGHYEPTRERAMTACKNGTDGLGQLVYIRNAQELEFLHWLIEASNITKWETVYTGMQYKSVMLVQYNRSVVTVPGNCSTASNATAVNTTAVNAIVSNATAANATASNATAANAAASNVTVATGLLSDDLLSDDLISGDLLSGDLLSDTTVSSATTSSATAASFTALNTSLENTTVASSPSFCINNTSYVTSTEYTTWEYRLTFGDDSQLLDTDPLLWPDGGPWAEGYPSPLRYECIGLVYDDTHFRWRLADIECDVDRPIACGINQENSSYTEWTEWSSCTKTCFYGTQYRTRNCSKSILGFNCTELELGPDYEMQNCSETVPCPIHGVWTNWTSWSECTVTCGGGTQYRTRTCTNSNPQYSGTYDCVNANHTNEARECNTFNCPDNWTPWATWSTLPCSVECGTDGIRHRTRTCINPQHGTECDDVSYLEEFQPCDADFACSHNAPQCADSPLGMKDGTIEDSQLSCADSACNATLSRLDQNISAWLAVTNNARQWVQVDLLEPMQVTGVITQGRYDSDEWVKEYKVLHSLDALNWEYVKDSRGYHIKKFTGNSNQQGHVQNNFAAYVRARYVRIIPVNWHNHTSMRFELLGCPFSYCYEPLGMADGRIPDDSITSSSSASNSSHLAHHGRLNLGTSAASTCWIPDTSSDQPHWLQIDLPTPITLQKVAIQGDEANDSWVSYYNLSYTTPDSVDWMEYYAEGGDVKIFYGNIDNSTIVHSTLGPVHNVTAIRFIPHEWHNNICLRAEIYGCFTPHACDSNKNISSTVSQVTTDGVNSIYVELEGGLYTNTMIRTLGYSGNWIKSYKIYFSQNNVDWALYVEEGVPRIFQGNYDDNQFVTNVLRNPIDAVYLKIVPVEVNSALSTYITVLGCGSNNAADVAPKTQVCFDSYGFGNYTFPTERISVSSVFGGSIPIQEVHTSNMTGSAAYEEHAVTNTSLCLCGNNTNTESVNTTDASGNTTDASGSTTDASGSTANPSGSTTNSSGNTTNASGNITYASENTTNASGNTTNASGNTTDASGRTTNASGNTTDATGSTTNASGSTTNASDNTIASTSGTFTDNTTGNLTSANMTYCTCGNTTNAKVDKNTVKYMSVNTTDYLPQFARLWNPDDPLHRKNGWVSENSSVMSSLDQWLEINFGERVQVTGLTMQGVETPEGDRYLSHFSLWYSDDYVIWRSLDKMGLENVSRAIIAGPQSANDVVRIELTENDNTDIRPLHLRYMRIQSEVDNEEGVGLRLEVYGCPEAIKPLCPSGWKEFKNSCYKFFTNETKTWKEAKSACEQEGAYLVTSASLQEHDFLMNYVNYYDTDYYYIGLDRHEDFSTYVWLDNTFFAYTKWHKGHPTASIFDCCVVMSKWNDGKWLAVDCVDEYNFICEYERKSTTSVYCSEETTHMVCDDDKYINITDIMWGRTSDWHTCPQEGSYSYYHIPCLSSQSYLDIILQKWCYNTTQCREVIHDSTLAYPQSCWQDNMRLYLDVTYNCVEYVQHKRICEGDFMELKCDNKSEVLFIRDAMYGRTMDNFVCPGVDQTPPTNCTLSSSLSRVRLFCHLQHECKIGVSKESFLVDPCEGVEKYLDVSYTCVTLEPAIVDVYNFQGECDDGWVKHEDDCFRVFAEELVTFKDAEEQCNIMHGHLAGIPSSYTKEFLKGLVKVYLDSLINDDTSPIGNNTAFNTTAFNTTVLSANQTLALLGGNNITSNATAFNATTLSANQTQVVLVGNLTTANISFWVGGVITDSIWRNGIGNLFMYNAHYLSRYGDRCIELSIQHNYDLDAVGCDVENAFICQQDCMLSFGMMDKTIRNDQILASSTKLLSSLDSFPWDARLKVPYAAWIAGVKDQDQWLQIDFERVMRVRKIATQGHPRYDFWVSRFKLNYATNITQNGSKWETYQEDNGSRCTGCEKNMTDRVFLANNDSNTIVQQYLKELMFARYLRLIPLAWHEEIALRIEVYGCYVTVLSVYNTTKLHYPYDGTIQCRAFGEPLPTLRWVRDGYDYEGGVNATIISYQEDDSHVVSEIKFHPLSDDRGFYTCVAENIYGADSLTFYNEKGLPHHTKGDKIVCDTDTLRIVCPEGEYIRITDAFYGRQHNEKCIIWDDYYPTDCEYDPDTVRYRMERQCNNKQHCMVDVGEVQFATKGVDYPKCNGFTKYLNVSWDCVGSVWSEWFNQEYPSDGTQQNEEYDTLYQSFQLQCPDRLATECREANWGVPFYYMREKIYRPCLNYGSGGLVCTKDDPSWRYCSDYEVRFLCPKDYHGVGEMERALECTGQELAISCNADYSIVVHDAFYGRAEEGICSRHGNYSYDFNCALNSTEILNMVKTNCDNKRSCKLNVQMSVWDSVGVNGSSTNSSCVDAPLYLDIIYDCQRFRQDHAQAKPSNQSSVRGNQSASFGNDFMFDQTDCLNKCSVSQHEWEPWYMVDMEYEYDINAVKVYSCNNEELRANMSNFEVRIGNSENFKDNKLCGNLTIDVEAINTIYCNGVLKGRYISVQVINRNATLYLCEVQPYYMGPKQLTAVACDGQTLQLSCSVSSYIHIDEVFYGRAAGGTICPHAFSNHTYTTTCETGSLACNVVREKCAGNMQCDVDIQSDILDVLTINGADPCPNEYKYLQVSYSCSIFVEGNSTRETTSMACMEQENRIACSEGNRFIEITSAYWKPSTTTTPHWCTNEAHQPVMYAEDVTAAVALVCDNKKACVVSSMPAYLGVNSYYYYHTTQRMYLEVNFNCKEDFPTGEIALFACEAYESELSLACPSGLWIKITDAFYGRTRSGEKHTVCRHWEASGHDTTTCRSIDTKAIVEMYCQGQKSCSLPTDMASLTASDPCEGIKKKYLEVSYSCEAKRPLGDLTLYGCADHGNLSVECPTSHPHLRIITANFGRQQGHMRCAHREGIQDFSSYSECYTPNILDKVRTLCTNFQNCTVPSYWEYYTDREPCLGTHKYLEVTYRCLMDLQDWTPCGEYSYFVNPRPDLKEHGLASSHMITTKWTRNILECQKECMTVDACASFHFETVKQANGHYCTLNSMIYEEVPNDFISKPNTLYFQRESFREFE